ncbi:hypothetical protein FHS55_002649 [Angulomicrobium tetraedrale]|uniref:Uncharacterized protein n=1 Tax=Ancylobacter tetraedralis TaxID=217068 RepID=A0A839ZB76_9HYPH|nr:hypothetical protein [Ancylobacter tetraedralis]MBB3772040.1 hypothetical protein [Ancylobacter tetraedralis]
MTAFQRTDATGRATGRMKRPKWQKLEGPFIAVPTEMLLSPAHRELSRAARQVLDRLMIEHSQHAGNENGGLICTHADFMRHGIDRHAIKPAIRELEALGFVRVRQGGAGNGEFRQPNRFRLTFAWSKDGPATNEWREIVSEENARALARSARAAVDPPRAVERRARLAS